ncbi:nuclear pore complex protein Nup54, partial [Phenoliferia sp. Uapishka_3]
MSFNFGAPAPKPAFTGFGATTQPAPTPSLFGQQTAAPSLFGASAAPAAGGLFGGASQPQASTSLFGSTATSQSPATSLFGQTAPKATSLFGASQPPASTSLFGASQPAPSTSLFGQPAAPPTTSLFGQSQPGAFGAPAATSQPPVSNPFFGQSQSAASLSLFGPPKPANSLQLAAPEPVPKLGEQYPPPDPNEEPIEARLQKIAEFWDTKNPKCCFQTYFYNAPAAGNTVEQYKTKPEGANPLEWKKAVRQNPDPERLVPALAIGFPAVHKRIENQGQLTKAHQARLAELHAHLATITSEHTLKTTVQTIRAAQTASHLSARLVNLMAKSAALGPIKNKPIEREDEELRVRIEALKVQVDETMVAGNELWAGVGAMKARKEEVERFDWGVADEEGLNQILGILSSQQAGLNYLTKVVTNATEDVDIMAREFEMSTVSRN